MNTFKIGKEFLLNDEPFQILSGAIHYFRIPKEDWYHSLYNLKALGFNTVETYIPWNLHEPQEGTFLFEGQLDIEGFLQVAQDLGLYAIVRPSPYICAEWEFGGLPAWLLAKETRIRSYDSTYLAAVERYYATLLPILEKHQLINGGNILMFQVENEYGSFGEEKKYLLAIKDMMLTKGITMPLCTSDGTWEAALLAGSLIDQDVLVTGNFGSKSAENFTALQNFFKKNNKQWPLMCMEFWVGWFNRWGEPIVKRESEELVSEIITAMQLGSINLYMFHGGTNFGFMNGCSARNTEDFPQITSYDYGALLNEQGNPTHHYEKLYEQIHKHFPHLKQKKPKYKSCLSEMSIALKEKTSLFDNLENLVAQPIVSKYPRTMEQIGQNVGYILYRKYLNNDSINGRLRIIEAYDRVQVYITEKHLCTQYKEEIGEEILYSTTSAQDRLDILVENLGRVNYGAKLLAQSQKKGIHTGVIGDIHFLTDWQQYSLPLDSIQKIDFSKEWFAHQPSFYLYEFELTETADCFVDLRGFGKGCVFINDINLGRFWQTGPILSLYLPHSFLALGKNQLVVFETEGCFQETLYLRSQPIIQTTESNL